MPGKRYTGVLAGFIGNVVEWYDFALYGYMAGILSGLFFPSENDIASLLATYGVFAAGFVMRPLGSGLFGWLGDTIGRSRTMLISVSMMSLPTFFLGCLPTYTQWGLWAPILLIVIRLVQGLSVGGEFSSSVTYLVETAPANRRGLAGSWANVGSIFGMLLGSGVATLVTSFLPENEINQWGWRLPFLAGGILGALSIIMRRHLPRSRHFQTHHRQRDETSPLLEAFTTHRKTMILAVLFASAYGALFYLPLVYLPEWLNSQTGMPLEQALRINSFSTALLLVLIPLFAWVGDHIVRRTHLIGGATIFMGCLSVPFYWWLSLDGFFAAVVVQVSLVCLVAMPLAAAPAMFVEMFPARDRLSGYSVAYNLGLGVVGGATPMISTWLIQISGHAMAPALYLAVMAFVASVAAMRIPDRSREDLL